jgi:hypothetical protein
MGIGSGTDQRVTKESKAESGGWSGSTPLITGISKLKPIIQAVFPKAAYYTIRFGVNPPNPTDEGVSTFYSAEATITWKTEGNKITRRISIGNGVAISGTGQACDVTISDTTPDEGQPLGQNYSVNAHMTTGTRPYCQQPVILQTVNTVQLVAPAGIIVYEIPQDAGIISCAISAFSAATPNLTVTQFASASVDTKKYSQGNLTNPEYISLVPNTQFIQVVNAGADEVILTLTWGIEG